MRADSYLLFGRLPILNFNSHHDTPAKDSIPSIPCAKGCSGNVLSAADVIEIRVIRREWPVIRKARASYWEIPNDSRAGTAPLVIAAPCAGAAKRRLGLVVICENVNVRSSYVCGQVHCVGAPQLHDALRPHARPSRDGAQPDGDDEPRRDDEPRPNDDAPAKDASVLVPS